MFVSLSLLLVSTAVAASKQPWFCHDLDCPQYTVGEHTEDYEVRTYAKGASAEHAAVDALRSSSGRCGSLFMFAQASGLQPR